MKKYFIIILIIAIVLHMGGCIDFSSKPNHNIRTTIKIAADSNGKISPIGFSKNALTLLPNIYEGLVELDENSQLVPSLAESWNNLDRKTWRFQIRENVLFHNGKMLTAEDIAFSVYQHTSLLPLIENITIIDTHTIDIITKEPEPTFLYKIADKFYVFPLNYSLIDNNFSHIGTGPYKLTEYVENNYTKLTFFDEYWGEKPTIKTIYFYMIEDAEDRLNSLLSGDIDIIDYNINENFYNISELSSIKIVKYSPLSTYLLGFDFRVNDSYGFPDGENPTANRNVREAIYHGINVTELINGPFQSFARPATQLLTPYHFGYNPEITRLDYDPIKARQLLNNSGYENGFDIQLDAITVGYEFNKKNAEIIKQQLSQIGINVTINHLTINEFSMKVVNQKNTSLWLIGWTFTSIDGGQPYSRFLMTEGDNYQGYYNSGYYNNSEVNQNGFDVRHELNDNKRNKLLQEGFRIALEDDIIFVPLVIQDIVIFVSHDLLMNPRSDSKFMIKDMSFT